MTGLRIRHLMIAVTAAAVLFTVARYDSSCTPLSPILGVLYVCAVLGYGGARRKGRQGRTGLLLGLFLGPLGLLLACSNPVPKAWPERGSKEKGDDA